MTSLKKKKILKICQTLVHPCVLRAEISWSWAGTAPLAPLGDSVLSNLPQSSPLIFIPKALFPSCHLPGCCNECKLCHKGLVRKHAPPQTRGSLRPDQGTVRPEPPAPPQEASLLRAGSSSALCFSTCQPHSSGPASPAGTSLSVEELSPRLFSHLLNE